MINSEIFFSNGILNKNKLRQTWIMKNLPEEYNDIVQYKIGDMKFSNVIYNYINDISEIPLCNFCNINDKRFIGFTEGYNDFCSHSCAIKSSSEIAQIKKKETSLKLYGVDHPSKLDSVKKKQEKTNIERWGTKSPTQNDLIKLKQEETMIKNWGVKYSGQSKELFEKSLKTRYEKYSKEVIERFETLNILNIPKEGELDILCEKCNNVYNVRTEFLRLRYFRYKVETCTHCNPISSYKYTGQNEISQIIKDLEINVILNDRKILCGKEIDIFIPDFNIAIEFNGLWWHSDLFKDKNYHLDKKKKCEELGINLIHIWEDDWIYKKDIIIDRIKNLLNINDRVIYSRKCKIVKVSNSDAKDFLNENHLSGSLSSINLGLILNDELVSIMTFGKLRRSLGQKSEKDVWEIYRFCNKSGYKVIGFFSKLLNQFIKENNPHKIVSYLNRDWSNKNNVYSKNNFDFVSETPPNYWYFKGETRRKHRFNYRKDKLISEGYVGNTESEIMESRGFQKIWDCGSLKYEIIT